MFSIQKSKVNFMNDLGVLVDKHVSELNQSEAQELCIVLLNRLEVVNAEKDAIVQTMNKFLSKDHPDQLQALMEKNYETGRVLR